MKKTVGMLGGKYYPLHLGHVYAMTMASTLVDELHVIVSYDEVYEVGVLSKNSKLPHVDYKQRVRWWKEITKDMAHVHVHAVYETNNGKFESWEKGAEGIREAIGKPIDKVFSSEHSYTEFFNKLYPEAEHVVIDANREKYPVSATKLRTEGVYKNWDMLPKVVQRYYIKKVAIIGTESCSKSTLTRNLATLYNTNYVEEYGRTFYEELGSYETFPEDYLKIAYTHKHMEEEGLKNADKVLFIDTEAVVTLRFLLEYHNTFNPTLAGIIKAQNYDTVILLKPDVEWVNDGTRTLGEQSIRDKGHKDLKNLLHMYEIDYIEVEGGYHERLKETIKIVDNLLT